MDIIRTSRHDVVDGVVTTIRRAGLLASLLLCFGATPACALVFAGNVLFAEQDRSIWAPGAGASFQGSGFLGVDESIGKTIGVRECFGFICGGAQLGANVSARVGFDYSYRVDSGTFDFQVPGEAFFVVPDAIIAGDAISIRSGFNAVAQLSGFGDTFPPPPAFLQVDGPTAQASLSLAAEFNAFAGAEICFVRCFGPALGPIGFNESRELVSINPGNSGTVTVLGQTVAENRSVSALGGLVNASLNIPELDSSSLETPNGFAGTTLTSISRDRVATINANVAQIAANAAGLPIPLDGKLGPIGYNLLQANAGLGLDLEQTVRFTSQFGGTYLFAGNVTPVINGIQQANTNRIDFRFGDEISFRPLGNSKISFLTIVTMDGTIQNQLDLIVNGQLDVKALGVNVADLELGPLINEKIGSDEFGRIGLFNTSFRQGFGSINLGPITLDIGGCQTRQGEISPILICGYDEFVLASRPPGSTETGAFYAIRSCQGRLPGTPEVCTVTPYGFGSDRFGFGRQYTNDPDFLNRERIDPDPWTTDEEQQGLIAGLGYTGPPSFTIQAGDSLESFAVPEPATWMMLIAGFGLTGASVRRRRPARVSA